MKKTLMNLFVSFDSIFHKIWNAKFAMITNVEFQTIRLVVFAPLYVQIHVCVYIIMNSLKNGTLIVFFY